MYTVYAKVTTWAFYILRSYQAVTGCNVQRTCHPFGKMWDPPAHNPLSYTLDSDHSYISSAVFLIKSCSPSQPHIFPETIYSIKYAHCFVVHWLIVVLMSVVHLPIFAMVARINNHMNTPVPVKPTLKEIWKIDRLETQQNTTNRILKWGHNKRDGVSSHQPHDCLLNRLSRRRSKKASKLRVTGLC